MSKSDYLEILIYAIIAYSLAILIYFSLKILNHEADFIAAFGSILSASAAFFTAYVAIKLYNDWRYQALFDLKKQNVNELLVLLSSSYYEFLKVYEVLLNLKNITDKKVYIERYTTFEANELRDDFFKKITCVKVLDKLNDNHEIFKLYGDYERIFSYFISYFNIIQKSYNEYYNDMAKNMNKTEEFMTLKLYPFSPYKDDKEINNTHKLNIEKYLKEKLKIPNPNSLNSLDCIEYNNFEDLVNKLKEFHAELEDKVINTLKHSVIK